MYETQFGLNKRPFRALAKGSDVFVGPQTAAAMAGLKKALASPDAIVAVGGPVGVGKTTIVRRALEAVGEKQVIIWVGRMQLGHDEVLELLLEEMGVEAPPGTVQRFTTFRRQLKQHAEEGDRVFIVVEDVSRIGADALGELEALTASDAGVSEGANLVLMGDDGLDDVLKLPQLARLRQRLRLRQNIASLSSNELLGYLKHCFRLAGNEFDQVFEDGSADVLHRLSGGIPRIANNLVESSLASAADNKLERVNVAQIKLVASEEYNLSSNGEPAMAVEPVVTPEPAPAPEPAAQPAAMAPPVPELELAPEPADAIPELIQDTLPDLEVLSPELAKPAEQQMVQDTIEPPAEPESKAELQQTARSEPTAATDPPAESAQPQDAVPDWEKDPTLAELRPDLDALEQAMAVAQGVAPDIEEVQDKEDITPEAPPAPEPVITLDREIQAKVDKAEEQLKIEEDRRAAAEAEAEKESGIDNRPTAEILAEARAREEAEKKVPDNSVEAQFEAAIPTLDIYGEQDSAATSDTIHELPVLRDATEPQFEPAKYLAPEPESNPEPQAATDPEDIPGLDDAIADLQSLETAPEPQPEAVSAAAPEPIPAPEPEPAPMPELALEPEPDPAELEQARKADAELEQIATNLARAKTIDDCDDKMAETLFGEEFSMMAAQVAASAPPELSANDDIQEVAECVAADALSLEDAPAEDAGAAANLAEVEPAGEAASAPVPEFDDAAAISVELGSGGPKDTSASQRLATVRALNASAETDTSANGAATPKPQPPREPLEQPQSIEDQINTSMTQTLQTLSPAPPQAQNDDDGEESKGGFFSRFKRS